MEASSFPERGADGVVASVGLDLSQSDDRSPTDGNCPLAWEERSFFYSVTIRLLPRHLVVRL